MVLEQVTIDEAQAAFLSRHRNYGFNTKDALVQEALRRIEAEFEPPSISESARLYAELYESDPELQELTEMATDDLAWTS